VACSQRHRSRAVRGGRTVLLDVARSATTGIARVPRGRPPLVFASHPARRGRALGHLFDGRPIDPNPVPHSWFGGTWQRRQRRVGLPRHFVGDPGSYRVGIEWHRRLGEDLGEGFQRPAGERVPPIGPQRPTTPRSGRSTVGIGPPAAQPTGSRYLEQSCRTVSSQINVAR
jgi:hypothetical protein